MQILSINSTLLNNLHDASGVNAVSDSWQVVNRMLLSSGNLEVPLRYRECRLFLVDVIGELFGIQFKKAFVEPSITPSMNPQVAAQELFGIVCLHFRMMTKSYLIFNTDNNNRNIKK